MLDVLIVVLISIMLIFGTWQILTYVIRPLRTRTQINQLLLIIFVSLGFGVLYDCFRTLSFMFLGEIWPLIDQICYHLKFFLLFVGVSAVLRIMTILSKQSGQKVAKETAIRFLFITTTIVLSVLNYYTFVETNPIASGVLQGFYTYQINPFLYIPTLIFYIPLFFYLIYIIRGVLKGIENKKMANEILFLGILLGTLIIERNINITGYLILDPILVIIIEFSLIAGTAVGGFIFNFKYPNLIEDISAFFCRKSVYLLWNNGGIVLFKYSFGKEETSTPDRLLMGGFLYAISCGLEETLKTKGGIKTIKVGNTYLIFAYGTHVFGMVFSSENISLVQKNLQQLIKKFETHYEPILDDWSGDLSTFDPNLLLDWVLDIFR